MRRDHDHGTLASDRLTQHLPDNSFERFLVFLKKQPWFASMSKRDGTFIVYMYDHARLPSYFDGVPVKTVVTGRFKAYAHASGARL